jgi:hypothetical protein
MPREGFEPIISVFERAKTFLALNAFTILSLLISTSIHRNTERTGSSADSSVFCSGDSQFESFLTEGFRCLSQ